MSVVVRYPSVVGQYLAAFWATVRRDATIFASYRLRAVSQVLSTMLTLAMFNYISKLVRPDAVGGHGHYYGFVVVGLIVSSILTAAMGLSDLVRMELMQGNFERVIISPLGPVGGAIALAIFPIGYAVTFAGLMLAMAGGIFGIPLHMAGIPAAMGLAAIGAIAFAAIGLIFVAGLLAYKSAMGVTWVLAGLSLLGGVYFPVRLFPGWLRWASQVQPFTPAVDLIRHALIGTPTTESIWLELAKLGAFTAVLLPFSLILLWQAVNLSRRRGTLMEY